MIANYSQPSSVMVILKRPRFVSVDRRVGWHVDAILRRGPRTAAGRIGSDSILSKKGGKHSPS